VSKFLALSSFSAALIAILAAVIGGVNPLTTRDARGTTNCTQSFTLWQGLAGHWEGTWVNHDFNSNGTLTLDLVVNQDCTAEATIEGIFNQSGPQTISATYHDGNSAVIEVQNDPIFGDTTIVIADDGSITLNGTGMHQAIESVTGTGDVSATELNLDIELHFVGGGTATETIHLEKEVTETPTPTPTSEPTPSPTPTESPPGLVQGNVDCNATVNSVDSLKILRWVAQLTVSQELGCPIIGTEVASFWGDVDCSGVVNSVDSLKILRYVAQLSVVQMDPCPDIGTEIVQ
jgi:hypothetical protein